MSRNRDIFRGIRVRVLVGLSILHLIATAFKWFSPHGLFILHNLVSTGLISSALSGIASVLIRPCVPINQVLVELGYIAVSCQASYTMKSLLALCNLPKLTRL